jgi:glycosyltransferase involved in cell wall biosynthesis
MYPSATHVVTVSEAARKSLQINFNIEKKRITSIPNPVHLKRIHSYLKRYTPNHPFYFQKQPVIICVARFHPLKNHLMLLRSFALVRKTTPVKLILLGQGSQRKVIERIIVEMGLSREVAVIDFKSRPYAFLANADISVLASYSEGQGLAVVESLACGVPVVCTNWKGVRELIHHGVNGIVCHMRDDALAAGLLAGLKLAKIRATQTAAEISAQKFDLPQIVEKYETLFFRLVRPSTNATLF